MLEKVFDYLLNIIFFLLLFLQMLEYYEQYDELEEILKKYVEVNPNHLNAYVYLCVHLHKHNAEPEIFIQYAKVCLYFLFSCKTN